MPLAAAAAGAAGVVAALLEVLSSDHAGAGCTVAQAAIVDKVGAAPAAGGAATISAASSASGSFPVQPRTSRPALHTTRPALPTRSSGWPSSAAASSSASCSHSLLQLSTLPRHPLSQEPLAWQHKNSKLAALALALLAMNKETRPAVVEAQAPLVLSDCLRRSRGEGAVPAACCWDLAAAALAALQHQTVAV